MISGYQQPSLPMTSWRIRNSAARRTGRHRRPGRRRHGGDWARRGADSQSSARMSDCDATQGTKSPCAVSIMMYGRKRQTVPIGIPVALAVFQLMPIPSGYPGW